MSLDLKNELSQFLEQFPLNSYLNSDSTLVNLSENRQLSDKDSAQSIKELQGKELLNKDIENIKIANFLRNYKNIIALSQRDIPTNPLNKKIFIQNKKNQQQQSQQQQKDLDEDNNKRIISIEGCNCIFSKLEKKICSKCALNFALLNQKTQPQSSFQQNNITSPQDAQFKHDQLQDFDNQLNYSRNRIEQIEKQIQGKINNVKEHYQKQINIITYTFLLLEKTLTDEKNILLTMINKSLEINLQKIQQSKSCIEKNYKDIFQFKSDIDLNYNSILNDMEKQPFLEILESYNLRLNEYINQSEKLLQQEIDIIILDQNQDNIDIWKRTLFPNIINVNSAKSCLGEGFHEKAINNNNEMTKHRFRSQSYSQQKSIASQNSIVDNINQYDSDDNSKTQPNLQFSNNLINEINKDQHIIDKNNYIKNNNSDEQKSKLNGKCLNQSLINLENNNTSNGQQSIYDSVLKNMKGQLYSQASLNINNSFNIQLDRKQKQNKIISNNYNKVEKSRKRNVSLQQNQFENKENMLILSNNYNK